MKKAVSKILSLVLTAALVLNLLPTMSLAVALFPYGMASTSIGVGSGSTLASATTQIGFGGQRWYVVGFNATGINKGDGTITLLAKGAMGTSMFSDTGSTSYAGSTLQTYINALPNSYDSRERSIMVGQTLNEVSGTQPTAQKIWALGYTEASTISSSVLELDGGSWVLRTMSQYGTPRMVSGGIVNNYGPPTTQSSSVRPGTTLNLSNVLYAAPISGTKDGGIGVMNSVSLGSEIKFTILDPGLSLTINGAQSSMMVMQGFSFNLDFSGAQT